MSERVVEPARLAELRSRAASRLGGGAADKGSPARIADALSALYTLASSPRTAADALALLHELQVHQVELDLQAQELQESRAEMELALRRQIELYDSQPVGCFTLDERLQVQDLNRTGAAMLGIEREDGLGAKLGSHFSADDRRLLEGLVARALASGGSACAALQVRRPDGTGRPCQVNARGEPGGSRCFVVLSDREGE
jgi:PAS domain S-box-containing protein